MSRNRDEYERSAQLYNAGDVEGFVETYTEDAVLVSPFGTAQGRAAIREFWSREEAAFPERTLTVDVIIEQGDTIASEFTWVATHKGPLVMADGTEVPPTGKRVEAKGMELLHMRDGKTAVHTCTGTTWLSGQLGVLPGDAPT